jgi:putative zinc finger/helix-turn-helix YgiT family protein
LEEEPMKCIECGHKLTEKLEARSYARLPQVLVMARVRRCAKCGEEEVGYPKPEKLHQMLARDVAKKTAKLMPAEIRFLRTYLGLSSKMLASTLGVSPETVSRWESTKDPMPMGTPVERFLRLLALTLDPVTSYEDATMKELQTFATTKAAPLKPTKAVYKASAWETRPSPVAA